MRIKMNIKTMMNQRTLSFLSRSVLNTGLYPQVEVCLGPHYWFFQVYSNMSVEQILKSGFGEMEVIGVLGWVCFKMLR